jgi:hypothetical protein
VCNPTIDAEDCMATTNEIQTFSAFIFCPMKIKCTDTITYLRFSSFHSIDDSLLHSQSFVMPQPLMDG